jgi:hypothetical protein
MDEKPKKYFTHNLGGLTLLRWIRASTVPISMGGVFNSAASATFFIEP